MKSELKFFLRKVRLDAKWVPAILKYAKGNRIAQTSGGFHFSYRQRIESANIMHVFFNHKFDRKFHVHVVYVVIFSLHKWHRTFIALNKSYFQCCTN